jgi:hypothetical protein
MLRLQALIERAACNRLRAFPELLGLPFLAGQIKHPVCCGRTSLLSNQASYENDDAK